MCCVVVCKTFPDWLCAVLSVVHGRPSNKQGSSTEGMGHAVCVRCGTMLGRRRHRTNQHAQEPIHRHSTMYAPFFALVPVASASGRQHLRSASTGLTTSSQGPNHDQQTELRCRGTISVEQSSCCSTETRDDSAHFQETTECFCSTSDVLANRRNIHHRPALLWRFRDSGADIKLQTYLLTYFFASQV